MNKVCPHCGTVAEPERKTRGSIWIEIVLWLCFLVPGIIYSLWRMTTRYDACPACGSTAILPVTSPRGSQIAGEYGYDPRKAPVSGAERFGRWLGRTLSGK